MKKIKLLFDQKEENGKLKITENVKQCNERVLGNGVYPTIKRDGSACMIKDGILYKRYDAKKGKNAPEGAIPCCDPDPVTGHRPHRVVVDQSAKENQYHIEGFNNLLNKEDGTYELCGPKINGNKEKLEFHTLIKHGETINDEIEITYEGIKKFLLLNNIEGIVFYEKGSDRMCKIRRKDYGIKW